MKGDLVHRQYHQNVVQKVLEYIGDFSPIWVLALLVPSGLVAYQAFHLSADPLSIYWLGALLGYSLVSLSIRRRTAAAEPGKAKYSVALAINLFDGLAIASIVIFAPSAGIEVHLLMVLALFLAVLAGIGPSSGYLPLFLAYATPIIAAILAVGVLGYQQSGSFTYVSVVFMAVFGGLTTIAVARDVFGIFSDAHISNLHNLGVNRDLKEKVLTSVSANDSKMRFLASASHDLRQPINALSMGIATLKLKKPPGVDRIIERMDTSIESINAQLLGLLDISKLDAGIVDFHSNAVNLVELLKAVVDTPQEESDRIVPIFYSGPQKQITCQTDSVWLDRIIRNLVSNAIKYTNKGKIVVKLEELPNNEAKITIMDTGIGIARENLGRVFDEFEQIDNPERDARKGLGLGLSIVKRTSALLGFRLELASRVDVGTSISVIVPTVSSIPFHNKAKSVPKDIDSLSVLALDNDVSNLEGMQDLLEQMVHKVYAFESFKSAELCISSTHIDLALVDYRMPGRVQGVEAIRRFKKHNPRLHCYLVTGDGNIEENIGDINVIHKPVTMDKFLQAFDF